MTIRKNAEKNATHFLHTFYDTTLVITDLEPPPKDFCVFTGFALLTGCFFFVRSRCSKNVHVVTFCSFAASCKLCALRAVVGANYDAASNFYRTTQGSGKIWTDDLHRRLRVSAGGHQRGPEVK